MATSKRKDNFVSKIVKDPANPPKTILLRGYLGDSSEAGHTRLYQDAQLNGYVEVPDDAILHEEEIPGTPAGESLIWIKQDAQVIHGEAGPQRRKASFFEGSIAAAARPALTPAFGCAPPPRTPLIACPPVTDQFHFCQTPFPPCEVVSALCPPTPACPTVDPTHGCLTPVRPCEVESLLCPPPVTHQLHGCLTAVRPCVVESVFCPPPPTPGCFVTQEWRGCPPPFTPLRGCLVTQELQCQVNTPYFGCPPPTPWQGCVRPTPQQGCLPPPLTPNCPITIKC